MASASSSGFGGNNSTSSSAETASSTQSSSSSSSESAASSSGVSMVLCGNGNLDSGEFCDDGNTLNGDGCGSTCAPEDHDSCGGPVFEMDPGTVTMKGSTVNAKDDITTSNSVDQCGAGTWAGGDQIFAIDPLVDGTLTVTLDAAYYNHYLHIRTACPGQTSEEIGCAYAGDINVDDVSSVPAKIGQVLYVIVDGYYNGAGDFSLTLTLQ